MTTYRSPGVPPVGPVSPSPRSFNREPVATPPGILTLSVCIVRTLPAPPQAPQASLMIVPRPWHWLHVRDTLKNPCWKLTWPRPRQVGQVCGAVPALAPLPRQVSQGPWRGILIFFSVPETVSSNFSDKLYRKSSPRARPRRLPVLPPKNSPKISPNISSKPPEKSAPPANGPPSPNAAWPNWSYCARFCASESTEYASETSLNFSSACLSPGLRSG